MLGTSPDAIDLAEDRGKFAEILAELEIPAPPHGEARTIDEARAIAARDRLPGGGAALVRARGAGDGDRVRRRRARDVRAHGRRGLARSSGARSTGSSRGRSRSTSTPCAERPADVFIGAVMEHIEEAGVHSGDSSCQIPPATLSDDELDTIEDITRRLARRLGVIGLLNLQLAVKDERIWVIEANPRASRTVPFVSKVDRGLARAGSRRWCSPVARSPSSRADGLLPADPHHYRHLPYTSVKAAVLPFGRFPGVDTVLGPEMKSTGEVMGIDADLGHGAREGHGGGRARAADRRAPCS